MLNIFKSRKRLKELESAQRRMQLIWWFARGVVDGDPNDEHMKGYLQGMGNALGEMVPDDQRPDSTMLPYKHYRRVGNDGNPKDTGVVS